MTQRPDQGATPRSETRRHFDEELDGVKRDTVLIAGLVLENARRASEAMLENRLDLAADVVANDEEVDARATELERRVFEIIARQQPVAGDLRFLISVTRMVYELERTGDLVVNCAKALTRNDGFALSPVLHRTLERLTAATCDVFARSIDALDELDAELGAQLDYDDDVVDDLVSEFFTGVGRDAGSTGLDTAIQLSRVGRYLERVADHGVNIGQHVTYIVTGSFPDNRRAAD